MNILLVEDNRMQMLAVSELLRKNGYTVFQASDGFQAIELADLIKMNLVISDIFMPKMGGIGLCDYMSSQGLYKAPFILITSASAAELEHYKQHLHNSVIVHKPIDSEELLTKVKQMIAA